MWAWLLPLSNFNPRGPCGPRRNAEDKARSVFQISILAVLADRDPQAITGEGEARKNFNPRGPCGPRQHIHGLPDHAANISILAVLADRDSSRPKMPTTPPIFQSSRSLRTATVEAVSIVLISKLFQSSRSLRTATSLSGGGDPMLYISILAVLADRDRRVRLTLIAGTLDFNPRGPCGPRRGRHRGPRRG